MARTDDLEAQLEAIANGGLVESPRELYYPPKIANARGPGEPGLTVFEPGADDPIETHMDCEHPMEVRR